VGSSEWTHGVVVRVSQPPPPPCHPASQRFPCAFLVLSHSSSGSVWRQRRCPAPDPHSPKTNRRTGSVWKRCPCELQSLKYGFGISFGKSPFTHSDPSNSRRDKEPRRAKGPNVLRAEDADQGISSGEGHPHPGRRQGVQPSQRPLFPSSGTPTDLSLWGGGGGGYQPATVVPSQQPF